MSTGAIDLVYQQYVNGLGPGTNKKHVFCFRFEKISNHSCEYENQRVKSCEPGMTEKVNGFLNHLR